MLFPPAGHASTVHYGRGVTRRDALLLKAASIWTFAIWIVFIRNLLGDDEHSLGFKIVHLTLAAGSIAFAVAIWMVARKSGPGGRSVRQSGPGGRSIRQQSRRASEVG